MILDNQTTQIVESYRQGLKVAEIAEQFDMEELAIKSVLLQFCTEYKTDLKQGSTPGFTQTDEEYAEEVIRRTMQYTEDEALAFKAACRVKDERKGRLDVIKKMGGNTINILQFNQDLKRAEEGVKRAKGLINITAEQPA